MLLESYVIRQTDRTGGGVLSPGVHSQSRGISAVPRHPASSSEPSSRIGPAAGPTVNAGAGGAWLPAGTRSAEHTSELQSHHDLVCRLPLEKKNSRLILWLGRLLLRLSVLLILRLHLAPT